MVMPCRFALVLTASLAGCGLFGRSAASPDAPYVTMRFCGVAFDGRTKQARFSIDLAVDRALPPGGAVEVAFDNPLEVAKPLIATRIVKGGERNLRIESPPVKGIEPREYAMAVRIYGSPEKGTPLATYTERCRVPFGQGDVGIEYR